MQIVMMVLALLLAVIISSFVARLSPFKLPLPLVQIVLGAALSQLSGFDVVLDPDVFFLLFIPPLLFLDGWRIPKDAFFHELRPILTLAMGLVIFTVVGMGPFIDWLIPAMPLAVAYALAAILSPTDPVAVSAIASATPIPPRLMHILEGEALLNDASGLVCFRFAVAAALTGSFSLAKTSVSFAAVAAGGLLIGLAVSCGIGLANRWLVRRAGEEPGIQILISLLVPFSAYLAAERFHVSGVLAAATAGITMHYIDLRGHQLGTTRMQRHVVWNTVQLALNGSIFVLLGLQLPRILNSVALVSSQAAICSPWHLLVYVVSISLAMTTIRFVWVWMSLWLRFFRAPSDEKLSLCSLLRVTSITAFAGVRGAVTLAGIMTLPLLMPDGGPFPARDLAILLAMGVILLSLLMGSLALPLLAIGSDPLMIGSTLGRDEEALARAATAEAAIRRLEQMRNESTQAKWDPESVTRLIDLYRHRRQNHQGSAVDVQHATQAADEGRRLRLEALRAEREELDRLRISHQINDSLHRRLVHDVDLMEAAIARQIQT